MQNPLEEFSFSDPFSSWWPFIIALVVGIITTIRSYISGPNCPSTNMLVGKIVIITGGSSGVGLEVVKELLKRKAVVIIATREPKKTDETINNLIERKRIPQGSQWTSKYLDLSSFSSIKQFADNIAEEKVDILINNAGIAFHPYEKSKDGYEMHMAVNYFGHFLLIQKLWPKLKAAPQGRVICTSAHVHVKGKIDLNNFPNKTNFSSSAAFSDSKLAVNLMTKTLALNWHGTNVTIYTVNPGLVRGTRHTSKSVLSKSIHFRIMAAPAAWLFMKTPQQAAQTIIYLAVADEVRDMSGCYFSNCAEDTPSPESKDFNLGRQLYSKTLQIVGC